MHTNGIDYNVALYQIVFSSHKKISLINQNSNDF